MTPNNPLPAASRSRVTLHRSLVARLVGITLLLLFTAAPAAAQYGGGGIQVFVDPVRVPVDQTFDVFGRDCAAGSTVTITIDGFPSTVATGTASAGGFYTVDAVVLPDGFTPGNNHDVRATCGSQTATALITIVCSDGNDPVDGSCDNAAGGGTAGIVPTTTEAAPAGGGATGTGTGTSSSSEDGLAFTGAAFTQRIIQVGVTLFGVGLMLVVIARRRGEETAAQGVSQL